MAGRQSSLKYSASSGKDLVIRTQGRFALLPKKVNLVIAFCFPAAIRRLRSDLYFVSTDGSAKVFSVRKISKADFCYSTIASSKTRSTAMTSAL